MTGQKGTEKAAATSEARGTAWGLHTPKTPKEEVASKKTGKTPGETVFPSFFPMLRLKFGGARTPVKRVVVAPFLQARPQNPNKNIPQGITLRDIFYESFFGSFFAKKE
ncbi:hypothetical protein [uncultured Subdoligranulum sp.]|uniref:hypothetical protein n=1 Tax=uncultured Subdoligranulum sp. TaxID=512298 RepID=UPI0025F621EC|nr:hypothetical protein [uncultured Subdoligranulum sp.]